MKKSKEKSQQKKDKKEIGKAKKANRKQLESSLSEKFKEVIKSLGHEAEVIAKDIERAGKLLAKRLSDKSGKKNKKESSAIKSDNSLLQKLDSAIDALKSKKPEAKPKPVQKAKPSKTSDLKTSKAATKVVRAAAQATSVSGTRRRIVKHEEITDNQETNSAPVTPARRRTTPAKPRLVKPVQPPADAESSPAGAKPESSNEDS